jgi:hypothetical protein
MAELQDAVKKFARDLAAKVESFISDIETLEVSTYTTSAGQETLCAYTSVAFDGDTTVKVPLEAGGEVNRAVWELHQAIVQQAMANRATMIQSIGEAAASALKALGIAGE